MTSMAQLTNDLTSVAKLIQEDALNTNWMDEWSDWHDQQLEERSGKEPPLH